MTIFLTAAPTSTAASYALLAVAYVAIFGGIYWFFIKPQKKREKEIREAQAKIAIGDKVVLSTGIYGEVVDLGVDVYIVEIGLNKGVRVPVRKDNVFPTEGYKLHE